MYVKYFYFGLSVCSFVRLLSLFVCAIKNKAITASSHIKQNASKIAYNFIFTTSCVFLWFLIIWNALLGSYILCLFCIRQTEVHIASFITLKNQWLIHLMGLPIIKERWLTPQQFFLTISLKSYNRLTSFWPVEVIGMTPWIHLRSRGKNSRTFLRSRDSIS